MTDKYSDLKKAALMATPGPWEHRFIAGDETSGAICHAHGWVADDFTEQSFIDTAYMAKANPAIVLALLADLDEAQNGLKISCAVRLKNRIEELQAERDALKAEANRSLSESNVQRRSDLNELLVEVLSLRKDADSWRGLLLLGSRPVRGFDLGRTDIFRNPGTDARTCIVCGERQGHGGLPCPKLSACSELQS